MMKSLVDQSKSSFGAKLLAFTFAVIISFGFIAYKVMSDNGNESSAASFISQTSEKQKRYFVEHHEVFADNFGQLYDGLTGETVYLEGYIFIIKAVLPTETKPAFYSITADPQNYLWFFKSESRHFYFDSTLVTMHSTEENRQAKADDPTV